MTVTITLMTVLYVAYLISVIIALYIAVSIAELGNFPWWGRILAVAGAFVWPITLLILFLWNIMLWFAGH